MMTEALVASGGGMQEDFNVKVDSQAYLSSRTSWPLLDPLPKAALKRW